MSELSGWQVFADSYSRNPRVQWPALATIAEYKSATALPRRRAYWRRKAKALRADIARHFGGKGGAA